MQPEILQGRDFSNEFVFSASRSGGAGGQNVNKVSTKMELRFSIDNSQLLTEEEKGILHLKLTRINLAGEWIIVSQTERSQLGNKEKCIEKFYAQLEKALTPRKKRKATRVTKAMKEQRLEEKKQVTQKKELRKNIINSIEF